MSKSKRMTPWLQDKQILEPFKELHKNIDSMFHDFFGKTEEFNAFPKTDISEKDTEYQIEAELPGIEDKDINVEVKDNFLVISGKTEKEHEDKKKDYHRVERHSGSFYRQFSLPDNVDVDNISAKAKNGVLDIIIPKVKPTKAEAKKIEIEK